MPFRFADVPQTFISSELFNTAAGGGNPALKQGEGNPSGRPEPDDPDAPRTGRVGYLVFENFRPPEDGELDLETRSDDNRRLDPPDEGDGGVEDPLDALNAQEDEQNYAILRLGTAVGSLPQRQSPRRLPSPEVVNTRTRQSLEGFAAGIAEFQTADDIGVVPVDAGIPIPAMKPLDPNLFIHTNPDTNRVYAVMDLTGLDLNGPPILMGGRSEESRKGTSAFIDDDTFAVRTPSGGSGDYALVTGLPLTTRIKGDSTRRQLSGLGEVPVLKHVQWGFFLGERLAEFQGSSVREHVHLGAWAAGEQLKNVSIDDWAGNARYEGLAIGNVYQRSADIPGNLSTVVGSYANDWHFGRKSGDVAMDFDGVRYTGSTALQQDGSFTGSLQAQGRRGRHDGKFVGGVSNFADGSGRGPNGLAGQFSISETAGPDIYRANGVVAADRKGK